MAVSKEGAVSKPLLVQGLLFVQGVTTGDMCDSRSFLEEPLLSHHLFKCIHIKLVKPCFLMMWNLWQPGDLKLALHRASVTLFLLCTLVWMDMMS